jgi:hypothetical protein
MPPSMSTTTLSERVRPRLGGEAPAKLERVLGHPLAFAATASILLVLYGATFVINPDRVAPTKDPAYYTWRTEALLSESPERFLELRGAFDMFAGGYRVAAPVLGGLLRQIPGMSSLNTTTFIMATTPVVTALLLAGFAYRSRRDPLLWHAVAFASASLYLTPPFVGYLDNVLCLAFLAAAVWFIGPARRSWGGRAGLFVMLMGAGFTHPTTLAIFCLFLGATSAVRVVTRAFDLRSVMRDDTPMLATAFAAALCVLGIWTVGIWGESASLAEAALPPPYGVDFFVQRLLLWIDAMRPALNGPLLVAGIVGLVAAGRRAAEDDLALISLVWLAPLAGLFGFLAGIAYPYYRFFNTTLAWVLLVGVGAYFVLALGIGLARRGGAGLVGLALVAAVIVVVATNLASGFDVAKWNDPTKGWLSASTRADLDALRSHLAGIDRPVVFVIDDETSTFQIWGFTKLSGNTSRYGLPPGSIDNAFLYLGSVENFLAGEPTERGEPTYDKLSRALLEDVATGVRASGKEPVVVVASAFNATGSNAELAAGEAELPPASGVAAVWAVSTGRITAAPGATIDVADVRGSAGDPPTSGTGVAHLGRVLGALALLLLPGVLAFRGLVPGGSFAEALGMVPALAMTLLAGAGISVLAVARAPLGPGLALTAVVLALAVAGVTRALPNASPAGRTGAVPR